jgi:F420-0:gamma-glutamyl ligase-like protein
MLAALIVTKLPDASAREIVPGLFGATIAMARISGIIGLVPSAIMIAILEWRAERRWIVYAVFGAILAVAASLIISDALAAPQVLNLLVTTGGSALLGIVSATAYWWIAGRLAGRDRPKLAALNGSA